MTFLEKILAIGDDALVEWDRIAINYEEWAARAAPMWFLEPMSVCRGVKYRSGREVPYATVHGFEVAAWIGGTWIVRETGEGADSFWLRVLA
jgi:hypothetical protein